MNDIEQTLTSPPWLSGFSLTFAYAIEYHRLQRHPTQTLIVFEYDWNLESATRIYNTAAPLLHANDMVWADALFYVLVHLYLRR
jgi:hypothetical protein